MDLILYNGNFITMDEDCPQVTAVAIGRGKIVVTGNDADILKLADGETKKINVQAKTVIPGFNDSHLHNVKYGILCGFTSIIR